MRRTHLTNTRSFITNIALFTNKEQVSKPTIKTRAVPRDIICRTLGNPQPSFSEINKFSGLETVIATRPKVVRNLVH